MLSALIPTHTDAFDAEPVMDGFESVMTAAIREEAYVLASDLTFDGTVPMYLRHHLDTVSLDS